MTNLSHGVGTSPVAVAGGGSSRGSALGSSAEVAVTPGDAASATSPDQDIVWEMGLVELYIYIYYIYIYYMFVYIYI